MNLTKIHLPNMLFLLKNNNNKKNIKSLLTYHFAKFNSFVNKEKTDLQKQHTTIIYI